jgi:hypothetical protein
VLYRALAAAWQDLDNDLIANGVAESDGATQTTTTIFAFQS